MRRVRYKTRRTVISVPLFERFSENDRTMSVQKGMVCIMSAAKVMHDEN
jgi:hypothetical protein